MNNHTLSLRFTTSAEMTRAVFQLMSHILKTVNLDETKRDRFMLAVGEAMDNAVIHGNKFSADKFIEVEYLAEPKCLTFMVSDQGDGFDFQKHLDTPLAEFQAPRLIAKTMPCGALAPLVGSTAQSRRRTGRQFGSPAEVPFETKADSPVAPKRHGALMALSGLGLALIRKCCDEVIYSPPGNKVTFVKYL